MYFSPENTKLNDPSPFKHNLNSPNAPIDQHHLYRKLNQILQTLEAEKSQFQDRAASQKRILEQTIIQQQQKITEMQTTMQKVEHQCRQLRFNYHQRGSVVDYLKKKVTIIEKKFDTQKQEMSSVIKYLENRNSQLNQIIFELKNKQQELNQNIVNLQEKYFNLSKQLCGKNITLKKNNNSSTQKTMQRNSLCHNKSGSLTPLVLTQKFKNQKPFLTTRQNNFQINSNLFEESQELSLIQSSIRQKTVKYQNTTIMRTRSEDQIDFAQLNQIINLGRNKQIKNNDSHQLSAKGGLLVKNYGQTSFSQLPEENRPTAIKKQKYLGRAKMSLPNQGRYETQLNTRRTNKQNGAKQF